MPVGIKSILRTSRKPADTIIIGVLSTGLRRGAKDLTCKGYRRCKGQKNACTGPYCDTGGGARVKGAAAPLAVLDRLSPV